MERLVAQWTRRRNEARARRWTKTWEHIDVLGSVAWVHIRSSREDETSLVGLVGCLPSQLSFKLRLEFRGLLRDLSGWANLSLNPSLRPWFWHWPSWATTLPTLCCSGLPTLWAAAAEAVMSKIVKRFLGSAKLAFGSLASFALGPRHTAHAYRKETQNAKSDGGGSTEAA